MMDQLLGSHPIEQVTPLNAECLEAAQSVLEQWDEMKWGFGNLLPLVGHVTQLDDPDEEIREKAHGYLSTVLESDGGYTSVAYAFSFVRLERHLNASLANWNVPSPTISAIFKGETTRLHAEALVCIPDISKDTFDEHGAISDTVDLEAQIAHAAYLICVLKNPELDQVTRFRAAAKLLSFHIPHFAVRSGQKRRIAQECYDVALQTTQSFKGVPEETLNRFLETMDYQPGTRKGQRAAKWFLKLSGLSQFDLLDVNKRMSAREEHMGEDYVTIRAQLEVESKFPRANKLLSQYYRVAGYAGRILVYPPFLALPDISTLLDDNELREVNLIPNPVISEASLEPIISGSDPTFLDNDAIQEILKYARTRHIGQARRDGNNHYEGHVGPLTVDGVIEAEANGTTYPVRMVALDTLHDAIEDSDDDELEQVVADVEDLDRRFGLGIMVDLSYLTKKRGLRGLAADMEQAKRLKNAPPDVQHAKFRDRIINFMTGIRKVWHNGALVREEVEYYERTHEVFGEIFENNPLSAAKWRLFQKVYAYQLEIFPVVEE